MQSNQKKSLAEIAPNMEYVGDALPLQFEQAWNFSRSYISRFLNEHPPEVLKEPTQSNAEGDINLSDEQSVTAVALIAAGRLDWLFKNIRPSLSGLFGENDISILLDCYQGDIFYPDQFNSMASDLCDHLGVEVDEYEASSIAPLVEKLLGLDAVQRVTLGDALEQAWHRGMKQQGLSPKEFFATLGIELT